MTHHVPPDIALIVAALDPQDPERRAAWEHAKHCEPCQRILEQGEAVLQLIDAQAPDQFIDPALKQRILNSVASLPPRRKQLRWKPIVIGLGAIASVAMAFSDGVAHAGMYASIGVRCVFWELLFALVPLAVTAQVVISTQRPNPNWSLALAGVIGGLAGQLFLRWRCPISDVTPHVWVFHCIGVVLAAGLGLVLARGIRWVRRV